jgi:ABC-type antimicrobial peptide transport system permease subunit
MLAPLLPGAIVFAIIAIPALVRAASADRAIWVNAIPFCVMLAVWLVLLPVVRRRNLKKIQQELDALGS